MPNEKDPRVVIWICGGIDSYGHVIGHPFYEDDPYSDANIHTAEEKKGTPWRWDVADQEFIFSMLFKRDLTTEEHVRISDWLISRGWKNDDLKGGGDAEDD